MDVYVHTAEGELKNTELGIGSLVRLTPGNERRGFTTEDVFTIVGETSSYRTDDSWRVTHPSTGERRFSWFKRRFEAA